MTEHRNVHRIALMLLFSLLLPVLGGILLNQYNTRLVSVPVHSLLEASGAIMAFTVSALIFLMYRSELFFSHFHWTSIALIGMGMLDFFHAMMMPGELFVWLHSISVLVGGLLFMTVWLPERHVSTRFYLLIPSLAAATSVFISLASITLPELVPQMLVDGEFSQLSIWINAIGGLGFCIAAINFLSRYLSGQRLDDLLFAGHTILFGVSGFLFAASSLWDLSWWLWHLLRLAAYGIALFYSYQIFMSNHLAMESATSALRLSEKKLQQYLDTVQTIILSLDREGTIKMINPAGCALLGYHKEELLGRNWFDTCLPDTESAEIVSPAFSKIIDGNTSDAAYFENNVLCRDGSQRMIGWHNAYLQDAKEEIIGAISSGVDITESKAVEAEREANRQETERLARMKSEFLANMSHEIRTPLNAILGFARIGIDESSAGKAAVTNFQRILDSSNHLLKVINNILDLSRFEAGKMAIESQPLSPRVVVDEVLDYVADSASAKGLEVTPNLAPDLPAWLSGDAVRLRQILLNLAGNAVKFTDKGNIQLLVKPDGGDILFQVTDSGIGIKQSQLMNLFTPYEQADGSVTRSFGGSGLGLAISQKLAKLMGGEITVESEYGRGSIFTLRLPLSETQPPVQKEAGPMQASSRLTGLKVLAAEDVELNRIILKHILDTEGAQVIFAGDGQQALDLLQEHGIDAFDVILMDIQMPVMDGYEATARIREMASDLPVIGFTAHALDEERTMCLKAGMQDQVTKPVDPDNLVEVIQRYIPCLLYTSDAADECVNV